VRASSKMTVFPILRKWFGFQLKVLLRAAAGQIASSFSSSAGLGRLPTRAQLEKLGPQQEFMRRPSPRHYR